MNKAMKAVIEIDNGVVSEESHDENLDRPTLSMSRVIDANSSFNGWGPRVNQTTIKRWN